MDLQEQEFIKKLAEQEDADQILVILGSPNEDSARLYAETVTEGDPTYAGPLAGVSLRLPVYHVLEDEIREQIDPEVYEEQVGIMADALDRESICRAVREVRDRNGIS